MNTGEDASFVNFYYVKLMTSRPQQYKYETFEEDVIHKLIEHFEREVRHALLGRDVSNTELLFRILTDFDFDRDKSGKQALTRPSTGSHNTGLPQCQNHIKVRQHELN